MNLNRLRVESVTIVFELDHIPSYGELDEIETMFALPGMGVREVHLLGEKVEVTTLSDPQPQYIPAGSRLEVIWGRK